MQSRKRDSDIEKEFVDVTWEGERGVTRESTTDIYTRHIH